MYYIITYIIIAIAGLEAQAYGADPIVAGILQKIDLSRQIAVRLDRRFGVPVLSTKPETPLPTGYSYIKNSYIAPVIYTLSITYKKSFFIVDNAVYEGSFWGGSFLEQAESPSFLLYDAELRGRQVTYIYAKNGKLYLGAVNIDDSEKNEIIHKNDIGLHRPVQKMDLTSE